jgi:hypothetical protein
MRYGLSQDQWELGRANPSSSFTDTFPCGQEYSKKTIDRISSLFGDNFTAPTNVPQCLPMGELREMNSRQEIITLRHISHPTEMQQYFRLGERDTISKQNPYSDLV